MIRPPIIFATDPAPAARAGWPSSAFVFHDVGGRRWPRIKRIAMIIAAGLAVLGAVFGLALMTFTPGRALLLEASGGGSQQVSDWPERGPASPPARSGTAPAQAPEAAASTAPNPACASPCPAPPPAAQDPPSRSPARSLSPPPASPRPARAESRTSRAAPAAR